MSTQTRLDAYLAAEAEILQAQEARRGDRTHRMAELAEVRKAIKDLQLQLARESSSTGLRHSLADLSRT
jgi:hypothetical protein